MRVAVLTGPGQVELRDEPAPTPGPEDVVVEIGACGLCTMERRLFSGEKKIYPVAPGHEAAGRVVEVGDAVEVIEAEGQYLMPGLAEMHGHLPSPRMLPAG